MKIIVSTKFFSECIEKALIMGAKTFDIIGQESEISFSGNQSIYFDISTTVEDKKNIYLGNFKPVQWKKLCDFFKSLPEQPVVIEFVEYMYIHRHQDPEIILSQLTVKF